MTPTRSTVTTIQPVRLLAIAAAAVGVLLVALLPAPTALASSSLQLSTTQAQHGTVLTISYQTDAPDDTNWIGIYGVEDGEPDGDPGSRTWQYTPGSSGTASFVITPELLPAGSYRAYFLAVDGYTPLTAPVDFEVIEASPGVRAVVPGFGAKSGRVGSPYAIKVDGLFESVGGDPTLRIEGPRWARLGPGGTVRGTPQRAGTAKLVVFARFAGQRASTVVRIPVVRRGEPLTRKLKVMSYNTWHAGSQVYQGQMKEIRGYLLADVDVVGLQEASPSATQALAARLGWSWYQGDGDTAVISRYPIRATAEAGDGGTAAGARISVDPSSRQAIWVFSSHLNYLDYGPYLAQEGWSAEDLVANELDPDAGARAVEIQADLAAIDMATEGDRAPVVLTGDFNVPSHRDWTAATASTHFERVVAWPATVRVEQDGFVDTFRIAHPDPAAVPGNTWSPLYPFRDGATGEVEPQDRIDFVFLRGSRLQTVDSRTFVYGTNEVVPGHGLNDWASDHASVVSRLRWR